MNRKLIKNILIMTSFLLLLIDIGLSIYAKHEMIVKNNCSTVLSKRCLENVIITDNFTEFSNAKKSFGSAVSSNEYQYFKGYVWYCNKEMSMCCTKDYFDPMRMSRGDFCIVR